MTITNSPYIGAFLWMGFVYLAATLFLLGGMPPFYRRNKGPNNSQTYQKIIADEEELERSVKAVWPSIFGVIIMVMLAALTKIEIFAALAGGAAIWGGIRVRQSLLKETGGPLPWLSFVKKWTPKWPMLVFDIWTASLCLASIFL